MTEADAFFDFCEDNGLDPSSRAAEAAWEEKVQQDADEHFDRKFEASREAQWDVW